MLGKIGSIIERFFEKFSKDETTTLAASLAFYMALSLAPLVILFVAISSKFSAELQSDFMARVEGIMGDDAARAVGLVIEGAKSRADLTSLAGIFGVVTILISASLIFGQLRVALNRIFGVEPPTSNLDSFFSLAKQFVKERLAHMGMALIFILILIGSLIVSSVFSSSFEEGRNYLARSLSIGVSFSCYILIFTAIFRYLPDAHQPWRRALQGGLLTAMLFEIGKELLGIYIGRSAVGSAYGAAGSLIVLLVWVYYSTLIIFVGAQMSSLLSSSDSAPSPVAGHKPVENCP